MVNTNPLLCFSICQKILSILKLKDFFLILMWWFFHLLSMTSHGSAILRRKSKPVAASEVLSVPERLTLLYIYKQPVDLQS